MNLVPKENFFNYIEQYTSPQETQELLRQLARRESPRIYKDLLSRVVRDIYHIMELHIPELREEHMLSEFHIEYLLFVFKHALDSICISSRKSPTPYPDTTLFIDRTKNEAEKSFQNSMFMRSSFRQRIFIKLFSVDTSCTLTPSSRKKKNPQVVPVMPLPSDEIEPIPLPPSSHILQEDSPTPPRQINNIVPPSFIDIQDLASDLLVNIPEKLKNNFTQAQILSQVFEASSGNTLIYSSLYQIQELQERLLFETSESLRTQFIEQLTTIRKTYELLVQEKILLMIAQKKYYPSLEEQLLFTKDYEEEILYVLNATSPKESLPSDKKYPPYHSEQLLSLEEENTLSVEYNTATFELYTRFFTKVAPYVTIDQ